MILEKRPNVIIFDADRDERQDAMIEAFRNITNIFIYDCKKQCITSEEKEEGIFVPIESEIIFDIILIHGDEHDLLENVLRKEKALVIGFGGYEGFDVRFGETVFQIHRPISSGEKALSSVEAKQIITFYQFKDQDPPSFFFSGNYNTNLERLVDFIHNELYYPSDLDWNKIDLGYSSYFKEYPEAWNDFIYKVRNIQKRKASIEPTNSDYLAALKELIENTINKEI